MKERLAIALALAALVVAALGSTSLGQAATGAARASVDKARSSKLAGPLRVKASEVPAVARAVRAASVVPRPPRPSRPTRRTRRTGRTGPAGPAWPRGTVGDCRQHRNHRATVRRNHGGQAQTGGYVVTFPEVVTGRLILVTPALVNDLNVRGAAIAAPCVDFPASCGSANLANSVSVFTLSTTGSQQDHSFTVSEMGPNSTAVSVPENGPMRSERLDSLGQ